MLEQPKLALSQYVVFLCQLELAKSVSRIRRVVKWVFNQALDWDQQTHHIFLRILCDVSPGSWLETICVGCCCATNVFFNSILNLTPKKMYTTLTVLSSPLTLFFCISAGTLWTSTHKGMRTFFFTWSYSKRHERLSAGLVMVAFVKIHYRLLLCMFGKFNLWGLDSPLVRAQTAQCLFQKKAHFEGMECRYRNQHLDLGQIWWG